MDLDQMFSKMLDEQQKLQQKLKAEPTRSEQQQLTLVNSIISSVLKLKSIKHKE